MGDPETSSLDPAVALPRPARPSLFLGLLRACRPKQWSKNVLLFFGLIFALKLTDPVLVGRAIAGFLVFCAASSGVYIINDLVDLEQDRLHPRKRLRPLAAGIITPGQAISLASILLVGAMVAGLALGTGFAALTILYVVLTILYSLRLKHVVLIDVFILAAGFVLRAAAGAVVVGVPISPWLYVCTVLASLFLGLGKRRQELLLLSENAGNHRPILEEYSLPLLDQLIVIVTAATIMAYSLYTFSADNLPRDHSMMLTIPFVLYGFFRYLYLVHQRGGGGSPEDILLGDLPLLITVVLWLLTAIVILYVSR
ncbi:MAG: decaprenyl-phosphate phosphoribosyltransferase [Chloroflexi bacterium]|nr:decaprenyl-phosphate phosphoribosyltransferase [Chloroflexota bacterium]